MNEIESLSSVQCAKAMPTDHVINDGNIKHKWCVDMFSFFLSFMDYLPLPSILISSDLGYDILLASSDLSNFDVLAVTRQPAIRTKQRAGLLLLGSSLCLSVSVCQLHMESE